MNTSSSETRLYDTLSCMVVCLDWQRDISYINPFGLHALGYERQEHVLGKPFQHILPEDDNKGVELLACIEDPARRGSASPLVADLLCSDGSLSTFSWSLNSRNDTSNQLAATVLIGLDATLMRESQAAAAMFQTVSDNYSGSIVITNPDRRILYINPAVTLMTGYSSDELIGQTPTVFKSGQTSDETYHDLWATIASGEIWKGEFVNQRKDGRQFLESKTIAAIRDAHGDVRYYFAIGEDVSQRQMYQERIESLQSFDQLTGLPNRDAFQHAVVGVLDSTRLIKREATILHVDIDDFFAVNDTIGTGKADLVIVEIAIRIREALRQADRLARLGNDKFGILLGPHEPGSDSDINEVAERVLSAISKTAMPNDTSLSLTASIGIASHPMDGDNAGELLTHAIAATESAKAAGGNAYYRFDASTSGSASGRRTLLNELKRAIERNELILHYQPQVSLFSGAIVGLEALIRWQHPQRGLLQPGEFIPLIEQSALIIDIGDWVLNESCRQMREWLDAGLPSVKVAINLAARHFLVPGLHAAITDTLLRQRIPPRFLEIEITESTMMQDVAAAIRSTTQLKEVGVRISLDDFGTGYSSLAYLSRFPIDVVKIDQSFVRDITSNPVNAAIAQATIAMSHKLGKTVLAEGVETEEQMQYLRRNECDEMQGYYFSRPVPAEEITRMLLTGQTMALSEQNVEARSTVLFVDDEVNILSSIKRTLRREGYEILTANSAAEGFSLLARNSVQVIVSDQRMPEMNGTEFLSRVKNLYPETVRMVLSGYSEISAVTDSINKGAVYRFMLKPWDDEQLKEEITGALRHWRELYGLKGEA